jgi:hypothetical protein
MGYNTDFEGQFNLDKPLDDETYQFLVKFNKTRRMKRNVGPEYGLEGEFYIDGKGLMGQDHEANVINYNEPPITQPSLWCQWKPTEDKLHIVSDGNEGFSDYIDWIKYLIDKILAPRGYTLSGTVKWFGEEQGDVGKIIVKNKVYE